MASLLSSLAETVGELTEQPVDALNFGTSSLPGVTPVGDSILVHHDPQTYRAFPPRARHKLEAPASPVHDVSEGPSDEIPDAVFDVSLPAAVTWENVVRARAQTYVARGFPGESVLDMFPRLAGDVANMRKWEEWSSMHDEVAGFFALATDDEGPDQADARRYAHGRIGGTIGVPRGIIEQASHESWMRPHVIMATHTGSLRLLDTLRKTQWGAHRLAIWLRMLVMEYLLVVHYTPADTRKHSMMDPECIVGYLELYYTTATLAHLYALSATLTGVARGILRENENGSLTEVVTSTIEEEIGATHKMITVPIEDRDWHPAGEFETAVWNSVPYVAPLPTWEQVFNAELPFLHARPAEVAPGPAAGLVHFCTWTETHRNAPAPSMRVVEVPSEASAMDLHVHARINSPYKPHRELPFRVPLSSAPFADACVPARVPLTTFEVMMTDQTLEHGKRNVEYVIFDGALLNLEYQYAAYAWASASYVLPSEHPEISRKKVVFTDFRLDVEESVMALYMAQALNELATRRKLAVHDEVEHDAEYRTLIARAILFQNLYQEDE